MFWAIVVGALGFLAFFATLGGALAMWMRLIEDPPFDSPLRNIGLGVAGSVAALLICSGLIYALVVNLGGDGSEHCGPGTRYVSESHYSPATKTTITDWMCVAA